MRPDRCCKVIVATTILHNICEMRGVPLPRGEMPNVDNPDEDNNPPLPGLENDGQVVRAHIVREYFWN